MKLQQKPTPPQIHKLIPQLQLFQPSINSLQHFQKVSNHEIQPIKSTYQAQNCSTEMLVKMETNLEFDESNSKSQIHYSSSNTHVD